MNSNKLSMARALALELGSLGLPIVLRYDIARIAWRLYRTGQYDGQVLGIQRDALDKRTFSRIENGLLDSGVLKPLLGVTEKSAFELIGGNTSDRNAIVCALDPFCYLSHLSAMEFHGLTDRMPEQVYISTPAGKEWAMFAEERMAKDLDDDRVAFGESGLPQLKRTTIIKIGQRPVHRYASIHRGAFRAIKGSPVRVATMGRTFLDMLREPGLCGGIAHVLQVFTQYAAANRRLIFDELDQHGASIDKVRAGFIFEELCQIRDPRIDAWLTFAARGGSRKLDPSADYEPQFSERWMLSINSAIPEMHPHD
jgi:predicted transcriptional regulator of viral defense system